MEASACAAGAAVGEAAGGGTVNGQVTVVQALGVSTPTHIAYLTDMYMAR